MKPIFVDTWFFIEYINRRSPLNNAAHEYIETNKKARSFVTTEEVLVEVLNSLSYQDTRQRAVEIVNSVRRGRNFEVIPQSSESFDKGLDLYSQHRDKEWGFTDCVSITVMREKKITEVLSKDRHFHQAGMQVVALEH